jgi:hypothetical protein
MQAARAPAPGAGRNVDRGERARPRRVTSGLTRPEQAISGAALAPLPSRPRRTSSIGDGESPRLPVASTCREYPVMDGDEDLQVPFGSVTGVGYGVPRTEYVGDATTTRPTAVCPRGLRVFRAAAVCLMLLSQGSVMLSAGMWFSIG